MASSSGGIHEEEGTGVLRQRYTSLQWLPPDMTEQTEDSVSHKDGTEASKSKNPDQLRQSLYIKPVVLIMMALIGALVGSVVGGPYGTVWAGVGIVTGFVVSVLLSRWLVKVIT